jgi:hypothetical protein
MFQPSNGHPQGVLTLLATKYMSRCKYLIKEQRVVTATYDMLVLPEDGPLWAGTCKSVTVWIKCY